ncbi:unnamed protein product [Ectocarpus fasciculatus]
MAQNTPLPAAAPLHDAAGVGDPVAVAGMLKDGADHNAKVDRQGYSYNDGVTALHIAAREDHLPVAVALLAAGAWPDGRASDDEDCQDPTPLHEASARGGAEVAKALLKAGAGKDLFASFGEDLTLTALSRAVENGHLEVVRTLAEAGADVNLLPEDNWDEIPPLVAAAKQGNVDVVRVLLDAGADINGFGHDGFSALHQAKDVRVMEVLLDAGADIEQGINSDYDSHGCDEATPIGWLCLKTHQRFSPLQRLGCELEAGEAALSSESEIERATAMVQLLLIRGAKIDSKAGCVGHCLLTGARGPPLSAAVYNGTAAICAALIDKGADLDATDWALQDFEADGDVKIRPIHDAARFGDVDILRLLLVAGAGANCLSNFRQDDHLGRWGTPLHVACRYSQLGCVRELLRWGADVWAEEKHCSGEGEEEEEEEEKAPCQCESCLPQLAGCGKTPAEVIGLRDVVTNGEIKARLSDSTTVGDSDGIRRELLWWRRCAVVLLADRLAKQRVSADAGKSTAASSANTAQRSQVLVGDDELLAIAGRMANLGEPSQGVFRHIVTFL